MADQTHQSAPVVLNRRTLERDNKVLAELLRPGMSVLDVGCGTGAITRGIAQKVGHSGRVVGVERDVSLLALAREANADIVNLCFDHGDAMELPWEAEFDVVSSARTLQWLTDPVGSLRQFRKAVKPGGRIVVLDYDHTEALWQPAPPAEFASFYGQFLAWRAANGWDNRLAVHLPQMYAEAGLGNVQIFDASETTERGDEDFEAAAGIWLHVIGNLGAQMRAAGFGADWKAESAHKAYADFVTGSLQRQVLSLRTAVGVR